MKKIGIGCAVILFIPVILILVLAMAASSGSASAESNVNGVVYVEHWSGKNAYTHHFLAQRYGITAKQIDGFIKSQGYEPVGRASGEAFLKAQAQSGIDVRVLVAFAQMESSYGTAGVAKDYPEANIWGYGCVDNDPNQGRNWPPERAFKDFREHQIERLGNSTLQILDKRAEEYKNGTLPAGAGVYYTDTSGTGKARAKVMEALDKYIDEHGGTPKPPKGYGSSARPGGGKLAILDATLNTSLWGGQCYMVPAFYAQQLGGPMLRGSGKIAAADIGTDYDWASFGWTAIINPKASQVKSGDIINWKRGADYSAGIGYTVDATYGHTAVVGQVLSKNRIMIYDQNPSTVQYHEITISDSMLSSIVRKGK